MKKFKTQINDTPVVLNICGVAQDYKAMFDVPVRSCMDIANGDPGQRLWPTMVDKHGIHPASWYHYTPHSKGCFITIHDEPVARCMMYRTDLSDKNWYMFGDIKYIEKKYAYWLLAILKAKKMHYTETRQRTLRPFEIPGFDSGVAEEGIVCPLPHCDNQEKDFSVTFEDGQFKFWPDHMAPDNAFKIDSTYDHDGYLRASEVVNCEKRPSRFANLGKHRYDFKW